MIHILEYLGVINFNIEQKIVNGRMCIIVQGIKNVWKISKGNKLTI